ncbi:MAG: hypothetical protein J6Z11_03130 [Candidatus Riflebacteria bacterium]|nr:hypothetical protein [Candidatus Riflebacteria bacterium]
MSELFFKNLENKLSKNNDNCLVVPLAADNAVKFTIEEALNKGLIKGAILGGDPKEIKEVFGEISEKKEISIIEAYSEFDALELSINEIKKKNANILMKGMCQSASLIKAVLNKTTGLEHGFMSHLTCFQFPDKDYFCILTDSAVNIAPDEETLIKEIDNANELFKKLKGDIPIVALLAANEKVSDKMFSTKLAEAVTQKLSKRDDMIVEGPVAFDLAVSSKSAQIKKYKGKLNGNANIFVAPRIETSNALYKSLQHYIKVDMGGILYGANIPIIHSSRADSSKTKYNSLLLGLATL